MSCPLAHATLLRDLMQEVTLINDVQSHNIWLMVHFGFNVGNIPTFDNSIVWLPPKMLLMVLTVAIALAVKLGKCTFREYSSISICSPLLDARVLPEFHAKSGICMYGSIEPR